LTASAAARSRASRRWLGVTAGVVAALLCLGLRFGSLHQLAREIDHTPRLFFDFQHYYLATARAVSEGRGPAGGYLYAPTLAIGLVPLTSLPLKDAHLAWGIAQGAATLWLVARTALLAPPTFLFGFLSAFAVLLSAAFLHSFKWGQIGAILAALILEGLSTLRRPGWSGAWLGLAIALKYYPVILAPLLVVTRRIRVAAWTAVSAALLLGVVPWLYLGERRFLRFYGRVGEALRTTAGQAIGDSNSQAIEAWFLRFAGVETGSIAPAVAGAFLLIALALLAARREGHPLGPVVAGLATMSLVPFFITTAWALYFCLLPTLQVSLLGAWSARTSVAGRVFSVALLLALVAQSLPAIDAAGGWAEYARSGALLVANVATLAAALGFLAAARGGADAVSASP
jgi:hypothetical protein